MNYGRLASRVRFLIKRYGKPCTIVKIEMIGSENRPERNEVPTPSYCVEDSKSIKDDNGLTYATKRVLYIDGSTAIQKSDEIKVQDEGPVIVDDVKIIAPGPVRLLQEVVLRQ